MMMKYGYHTHLFDELMIKRKELELKKINFIHFEDKLEFINNPNYDPKDWDRWNGWISTAPAKHFINHHYFLSWEENNER